MLELLAKMPYELDAHALEQCLVVLSPRSRLILELHYGLNGQSPHTCLEIAHRLGVTKGRVVQIEQSAVRTLSRGKAFRITVS